LYNIQTGFHQPPNVDWALENKMLEGRSGMSSSASSHRGQPIARKINLNVDKLFQDETALQEK
jgi:hypothetical protein